MENSFRGSVESFLVKGVYHLYKNKTVVYVGMSNTCCMQRIVNHNKDKSKIFTHFRVFPMPHSSKQEIEEREKQMIKRHLPIYNSTHTQANNKYWLSKQERLAKNAKKKINNLPKDVPKEFADKFFDYLYSTEWNKICKSLLSIRKVCEHCKVNEPIGVYHRNYGNVFNESFKDVIAVCGFCKAKYNYKY